VIQSYKELEVWQISRKLVKEIYLLTKRLPKDELYGLTNQMRRSAVSVASNIAEGQARNSTKEFVQFLFIAKGSSCELETQLILCVDIGYFDELEISECVNLVCRIGQMITALTKKLQIN
jgi:four helix bundle protein